MNLSSFLQWRFNIFLYNQLGWKISYYYITLLHGLYYFFKRREKRQIEDAIESVFYYRKTDAEIRSIKRKVLQGIRFHYYEKLFNAFSSPGKLRNYLAKHMESQGMGAIEEGLSRGKGILLITGHFGAVEFIPGYLAAKNYPVTILVRFSSDRLREISIEKAARFGARIIDVDKTANVLKAILQNLRENRIVITQCDEIDEWRPAHDHTCSFLGKQVNLDRTISILMRRAHASIVFGIVRRDSNCRYTFFLSSGEEMTRRLWSSARTSLGIAALKLLEQYIYKYPEEWYQWKKYASIITSPSHSALIDRLPSLRVLKPSLGKAS